MTRLQAFPAECCWLLDETHHRIVCTQNAGSSHAEPPDKKWGGATQYSQTHRTCFVALVRVTNVVSNILKTLNSKYESLSLLHL